MKINRPATLNCLDFEMIHEVYDQIRLWESTEFPKVLLVSGTGKRAFSSGGDIVSLYEARKTGKNRDLLKNLTAIHYIVDHALASMQTIQISVWNGIVMGAGVGLSCHAPIRICMDNSVYAMPESRIGYFTDVGGSYFLPRIHNNECMGLYLGVTGQRLKGSDLLKWGVATHYVKAENIEELQQNIKEKVTRKTTLLDV